MKELVGVRIDSGVQLMVAAVDTDRFLVDGHLQSRHCRRWLEPDGVHAVLDRVVTLWDAQHIKILTTIA